MTKFNLTGLILIAPVILSRFFLLTIISKDALERAAFFPPAEGIERPAYLLNIVTTLMLLLIPFFLEIDLHGIAGFAGMVLFATGLILYSVSIIHFAGPDDKGINRKGLYRISRNPMYIAFFIYFLGCCLMTRSWLLFIILVIFQVTVHFMIISEERWCIRKFGDSYREYTKKVRRYI